MDTKVIVDESAVVKNPVNVLLDVRQSITVNYLGQHLNDSAISRLPVNHYVTETGFSDLHANISSM